MGKLYKFPGRTETSQSNCDEPAQEPTATERVEVHHYHHYEDAPRRHSIFSFFWGLFFGWWLLG